MSGSIAIRPLRLDERADWEPLWKGYLDFYKTSVPQQTYDTTWARLHDPDEPMWLLGGSIDGKLLGIVHYLYHRSCWTVGDYCYLQDLFVADSARNRGLGRALILAVEHKARAAGASRVPGMPGVAIEGPAPGLVFRARLEGAPQAVELVPFHRIAHERYTLYWRLA